MKKIKIVFLFSLAVGCLSAQSKMELKTAKDSASYAFGMMQAQRLKAQLGSDYDMDMFMAGLRATLMNGSTLLVAADAQKCKSAYDTQISMKAGEKNIAEGKAFLEKNKQRKEVTTTASGLQYEVLKRGDGKVSPAATDKVKAHYTGTLLNGEKFDSSVDRGQPIEIGLNQVIKGWTEGMQMMHVGDKFKFYIPYDLGYGERAAGAAIKPFSTLIFEVELLEIMSSAPVMEAPKPKQGN